MMRKWVQIIFAIMGGGLGYQWSDSLLSMAGLTSEAGQAFWIKGLCVVAMFLVSVWIANIGMKWLVRGEQNVDSIPVSDLLAGTVGLVIGLLVSVMLYPVLEKATWVGPLLPFVVATILAVMGFRIGYNKRDELIQLLKNVRSGNQDKQTHRPYEEHKILDTSVIIDGRIADICKTGFIEGTLVIPEFVLEELQHIADSSDLLKRNRGRRGLDILNKIQKELEVKVLIYEGDFEEISEVDSKLVKLAKVLQGKVITNDFNLNKVCELQGVSVLNINDLANAVKPVVLPGEEIIVQVIKDGKEHGQGVAYLDDGTMIVVEGGREFIGSTLEVMVTSVLQTSAGRMIFAKPKLLEKAQ
ncbi:PIN/TRAM domain-containing protein [Paenibacillus sp. SYP-B3998]|uniref:PIN/TRAM domain-containing protein n=1 Tax=Paenibacillus sp. SYP-B3998 TaxID=2678564 RepID=A0A6G4A7A9_9BACL|nr:PIN/TRAM domain-containing protein [Paenibacillus sp. SYP-B3998]NEW09689.1 PIN/TRAM domain-containing protein [Paenibacillus sp. SYP-B3998]